MIVCLLNVFYIGPHINHRETSAISIQFTAHYRMQYVIDFYYLQKMPSDEI